MVPDHSELPVPKGSYERDHIQKTGCHFCGLGTMGRSCKPLPLVSKVGMQLLTLE